MRKNNPKSYRKPNKFTNNKENEIQNPSSGPKKLRMPTTLIDNDGIKGVRVVQTTTKKADKLQKGNFYTVEKKKNPQSQNSSEDEDEFIMDEDLDQDSVGSQSENVWSDNIVHIFKKIIKNLSVRCAPGEVNFRDKEKFKISNFLTHFVVGSGQGCSTLIVTGQPGAGKTLLINTFLDKIDSLQMEFFSTDAMPHPTANTAAQNPASTTDLTAKTTTQGTESEFTIRNPNTVDKNHFNEIREQTTIHIFRINAMTYRVCIQFLIDVIYWVFELSGKGFKRDIIRNAIY
jgi:hypothetical protein